ncbi:murein hydrolase activator NlpD [Escherichia coli]|nr:murein hydrolase activator NlpD [Escherichia coli]
MSAGSPKFTVRRIAALSLVSLWLAGCSDTSNPPAPVSSVNGNAPANTNSGMLITPPPKMGTTSTAQQPQIQPVQQPQIQATQQPQIQPVQPVAQQPVQMENGRIVYNRQYGNIPKGSYSGSTYTVKKGDTLFYIAWITGNDFRDLAQRNNIQAPYALNVGQTLQVGNASGTPITGGNAITQADAAEQGVVIKPAQNSTVAVASQPTITYSESSGEQSANKMLPNNKPTATTVTAPVTVPTASTTEHFGKQNVGIYRMEVKGKRKLGLQPVPMHDIALHLHKAEERGEDLPIAITLGNDPIITLMGATPLKYDQSEYEMAGALRESPYPIATAPLTGFDVPWGSEVILEGVIESRKREIEGPFGEFTGHYSGGRNMTVVRIDKVSYRTKPIFESLYLGMPWTEIDYLMGPATCVPLYQQLKAEFPEVQAVNAMYTHGLLAIISTKKRYGGFARAVGLRAMTTPHGLGYVKMVIMVDEDVDPFNLPQVMWALSSKVNPAGDLVQLPNMSVLELDPGSSPAGITDKLIIDATTPVAPDNRGHYSQPVVDLPETKAWAEKLTAMLAARQ